MTKRLRPDTVRRRRAAAWSVVLGLTVTVAVAPLMLIAGWCAWFEFNSRFMAVPAEPDHVAGATLIAVMFGLLALPVVIARYTWRRLAGVRNKRSQVASR